jgi:MtrB/PioB family decaheme-associated outer membrane protein
MKYKIFILAVSFGIMVLANSYAQERKLEGKVSITGVAPKIEGEKAKFNEYRDIRDGIYVGIDAREETDKYYTDFKAEDIGYKTQEYGLEGGKWGSFKYHFEYTEIPHNFTYGAKSFYTGIGGANLTHPADPPSKNINTWTTFDYSVERTNYGGGLKLEMLKPFYFDISYYKDQKRGVYPFGAAGTTPGGIAVELPAPIDYTTDSIRFEGGYVKNPLSLSLGYSYSTFQNDNSNLNFRNPATANTAATTDSLTLPPNNNYYKLDFKGAVKLPLQSRFNVNLAHSRTQSGVNLFNSYVANVAGGRTGVLLSDYAFNGEIDTQSYDFLLTSSPMHSLEGKLFYRYYNTNNKSDSITTTDSTQTPATFSSPLFDYRKERYGVELGFKLPASFYLTTAYTHAKIQRSHREDFPENTDDIYEAELRWRGLDFMEAKVAYERLQRRGDLEVPAVAATDPRIIETWVGRFDAAPRERDTYKASVDLFPIENLNINLGYKHEDTNYRDTTLGLKADRRNEFNFDADYLIAKRVRLFGYFDYEYVKLEQFQRQLPFNATSGFDPFLPPTSTFFNWTVTQTENNWAYGVGTDVYILLQKLTLNLQYNNWKSDGFSDYTYLLGANPLPAGQTQDNIDISNWGNYQTRSYMAKLIYNLTQTLSFSAGYAYEKFIADDAQYNGYLYVSPPAATRPTFLTGAYQDWSYEANVVFLTAACQF